MTPVELTPVGVAMTTLPRVPEDLRALVAATGACDITFRTRLNLGDLLNDLTDQGQGSRAAFGLWSVDAGKLLHHLLRAAPTSGDAEAPVGVGFAHAGPALVLVLAGVDDTWRVGVVAEHQRGLRAEDGRVEIEPVAPPGVEVTAPPEAPARTRPAFKLLRGGG